MVVDWLTKHYAGVIREALAEVGRAGAELEFVTDGRRRANARAAGTTAPRSKTRISVEDGVGLSPRYSFDTFIVGASNQFAHAACRAVAEAPSRSYNPLFLYGGVGSGQDAPDARDRPLRAHAQPGTEADLHLRPSGS